MVVLDVETFFFTDKMTQRDHNSHFRHRLSEVWDEHPHYVIDAFGQILYLELKHDSKFVSPDLQVSYFLLVVGF